MAIGKSKPAKEKPVKNKPVKAKAGKKGLRGKIPTKQSINLVIVDESKINPLKAIPLVIVVVALAALFSKFMVFDRLAAMNQATGRVSTLQTNLQEANSLISTFGELQEEYAHYTYSGMTEEELGRVDRVEVLKLAESVFAAGDIAKSWRLSGNILTAEVGGESLEELNQLAQKMEESPIVDRVAITNASKAEEVRDGNTAGGVRASFIVYLQQPVEEVVEE